MEFLLMEFLLKSTTFEIDT